MKIIAIIEIMLINSIINLKMYMRIIGIIGNTRLNMNNARNLE